MDDLDVLARDFGFRPQGKSAPMRSTTTTTTSSSPFNDYDSIFKSPASNDGPVYDKPVYDDDGGDDIFAGLAGMKSKSVSSSSTTKMKFEDDVFDLIGEKQKRSGAVHQFDDLLGSLGRGQREEKEKNVGMEDFLGKFGRNEKSSGRSESSRDFDDLLGGFGTHSPAFGNRPTNISPHPRKKASDGPFVTLDSTSPVSSSSGVFTDPLKVTSKLGKSGNTKVDTSSISGGTFDDIDPLSGFNKSVPPFSPEKDGSPSKSRPGFSAEQASVSRKHMDTSSFRHSESNSQKKVPVDNLQESPLFDIPSVSTEPKKYYGQNVSPPPPYSGAPYNEKNFQADVSPRSEELPNSSDDIWLSVSEVPLFTQPTKAPPPSRPPPPIPHRTSKVGSGYFSSSTRKKGEDYSASYSSYSDSPKPRHPEGNNSSASQIDDLEDFAMGRSHNNIHNDANIRPGEDMDAAAAAMKEAMDRAEAKFRHAKEVREREYAKTAKSKENFQAEIDEETTQEAREREYRERLELERRQKEKEEEEREQRRLEKERTERERGRQAVERATREARGRAAEEARLRAERVVVGKAQAEARERAGKAAVQRVQAEARERAATEAKERAEKAAAEAREREAKEKGEAQRRSQRAAVERAAAEARERAAADARERASNAARASQQKAENDLESFFSSRPNSVPKTRTSSSDPFFDQFQNKGGSDTAERTSSTSGPTSNIKKASSATNFDDLSSIFGAPSSSGNFQEVEGETEERRRARLERHQRTQERAAAALDEKNQRDMQVQRDQEERHRIGETLDFEIKRWSAGKEGNLRALLSTLQYVLWPECGWQPVSLTDLITGASVKKVYRKATLCIHPDKVQQKGATLQQKYIAEKVFDLLKEAWNKFNSEELF